MRISFRVNENKDKDIYEALENCSDITKQVKRLIRRGMMYTPPEVIEKVAKELNGYSFEENENYSEREPIKPKKKKNLVMDEQIEIVSSSTPQEESSEVQDEQNETTIENQEETIDEDSIVTNFLNNF